MDTTTEVVMDSKEIEVSKVRMDVDVIDKVNATVLLPMEVFPSILAFCPMSSLLTMRRVSKVFRNDYAIKESMGRYLKAKNAQKEIMPESDDTSLSAADFVWGKSKEDVIEKTLSVAKTMYFRNREPAVNAGDNQQDQSSLVLMADGYDETKVKALLEKTGNACSDENTQGRGKMWKIEARYKELSLVQATREMKVTTEAQNPAKPCARFLHLILGTPPGTTVKLSEYEILIRKYAGGPCEMKACQLFTWVGADGIENRICAPVNYWYAV
jgi:hypothetical protein